MRRHLAQIFLCSNDRNSGPKSRGISRVPRLCVAALLFITTAWRYRGEGWILAMQDPGAPPEWISCLSQGAKRHGMPPAIGLGRLTWHPKTDSVKKRSLRRAYQRSLKDGCAWYKGQCWVPGDFPISLQSSSKTTDRQIRFSKETYTYNDRQRDPRRLSLVTWNCGGLSKSKLDDLRLWMEQQRIDGMVITETRWRFTSEWADTTWNYLHSGDAQPGAQGILVMLHRRFLSSIRYTLAAINDR